MKNARFRMNFDFAVNAVGAALLIIVGVFVIIGSGIGMAEVTSWFADLGNDGEYMTVLSIFFLPVMLIAYIVLFALCFILGYVPTILGLTIGALTTIARFVHTNKGTEITKPYRVMMTIANIITCSTFVIYAFGIVTFILSLMSNSSVNIHMN
ncbi:MAG: hypothetical protein IKP42_04515 [Ruminococcus sp.]|nr:hypothetical protein [Ruminococcus sp.]